MVDKAARMATARNHSCTHLLHKALANVLGDHVKQSGSLVGPDRLRFDFTHISAMTPEEIKAVELEVNAAIMENHVVDRRYMDYKAAVADGATALFGEKYSDKVCVVRMGDVSMELCGGTHLSSTGQAGSFMILSEGGVAAGIRRIEAATGFNVLERVMAQRAEMNEAQAMLKARPGELVDRIKGLHGQVKDCGKEIERLQAKMASGAGQDLMSSVEEIGGIKVLAAKVESGSVKALRDQVDALRSKLQSGIICFGNSC